MKLFRAFSYIVALGSVLIIDASVSQTAHATVADDLTANYNKVVSDWGSANKPALLCSGVLLRFTSYSQNYHAWDPSPGSVTRNGVSFMYLRKDSAIKNSFQNKTSGIIFYPSMQQPASKAVDEARCAFPTDGRTDQRAGACGASTIFAITSMVCQDQGIFNATNWYRHFNQVSTGDDDTFEHQCGFDISNDVSNRAAIFMEDLKAHAKVVDRAVTTGISSYGYTEIILKTLPNQNGQITEPKTIPIQAFFYRIDGTTSGLPDAKNYQKDYYKITGIAVPIVQMVVPADFNGDIGFTYNTADQAVRH